MASSRVSCVPIACSMSRMPAGRVHTLLPLLSSSFRSTCTKSTSTRSFISTSHKTISATSSATSLRLFPTSPSRHFNSSSTSAADTTEAPATQSAANSRRGSLNTLSRALGLSDAAQSGPSKTLEEYSAGYQPPGEHHLYIYAHKHNTQITLSGPQFVDPQTKRRRQHVIMTLSTGNIGYRKSNRGTYEAAYQLGSYVLNRIQLDGLLTKIQRLEVVLRGFGNGREALIKLLLGQEGSAIRDRVIRVTDSSRVKMGGQRARKPRRLG